MLLGELLSQQTLQSVEAIECVTTLAGRYAGFVWVFVYGSILQSVEVTVCPNDAVRQAGLIIEIELCDGIVAQSHGF